MACQVRAARFFAFVSPPERVQKLHNTSFRVLSIGRVGPKRLGIPQSLQRTGRVSELVLAEPAELHRGEAGAGVLLEPPSQRVVRARSVDGVPGHPRNAAELEQVLRAGALNEPLVAFLLSRCVGAIGVRILPE